MKVNRTRRVKDMYMKGVLKVNKYIQKIDELNTSINKITIPDSLDTNNLISLLDD